MSENPRGLLYLAQIDEVVIKLEKESNSGGFQAKLYNKTGQEIFYVIKEQSAQSARCTTCTPAVCDTFEMIIYDNDHNAVVEVVRSQCASGMPISIALFCCCITCCLYPALCCTWKSCYDKVEVRSPPGNKIGSIEQQRSWSPKEKYCIKDEMGKNILAITGPVNEDGIENTTMQFKKRHNYFPVSSDKNGSDTTEDIGRFLIPSDLSDYIQDNSDEFTFGVSFQIDLDIRHKAILVAELVRRAFLLSETQKNLKKGQGTQGSATDNALDGADIALSLF